MTRAAVAAGAFASLIAFFAWDLGRQALEREVQPAQATSSVSAAASQGAQGLIYGRVTTDDGAVYEGRMRWGGDEEALWGNYFNGRKDGNPWLDDAPADRLPIERLAVGIFGFELIGWNHRLDLSRPFMARFGDIARIDPRGGDIQVTLKSGSVFHLDRYSADDLADGVRVWDDSRGVVDIGEWHIRSIELLPTAGAGEAPSLLYGTVRTRQGDFTGLIQWNREECLGTDEIAGRTADGDVSLRFEAIRSIARRSRESALVTLLDGRELELSGARASAPASRGMYVDDPRYGRVLVSWEAFERVDFSPIGTGPAYDDFPAGRPLTGSVITRSGRRLTGRLVYDLDESETTETLDAPSNGVDYTIPFELIASIALPAADARGEARARVGLRAGEVLELELGGDLGELNGGMLIFSEGGQRPEYVTWAEVAQIDLDPPPASNPTGSR